MRTVARDQSGSLASRLIVAAGGEAPEKAGSAPPWRLPGVPAAMPGRPAVTVRSAITPPVVQVETRAARPPVDSGAAPEAADDTASTVEDVATTLDVLPNDADGGGDALSITGVTTPAHGTAVVENGKIAYTPAQSYSGSNTLTYTVSDGYGETDSALGYHLRYRRQRRSHGGRGGSRLVRGQRSLGHDHPHRERPGRAYAAQGDSRVGIPWAGPKY